MYHLVLYGSYNLSSDKCMIQSANGERDVNGELQRIANAEFAGSTIVGMRIQEKPIALAGTLLENSATLQDVIKEFDRAVYEEDRYFRITRSWKELSPVTTSDGWNLGGDAVNKTYNTANYMFRKGSLSFDADVSASASDYAEIIGDGLNIINVNDMITNGMVEFWMYIPDITYITGTTIIVGSNSTNLLTSSLLTSQYDSTPIKNGWNYFSVALSDMVQTGLVDYGAFGNYFRIRLNYSASQGDLTGILFGGAVYQDDSQTRNYKSYVEKVSRENANYNNGFCKFTLNLLAYEGVGESTDELILYAGNADASSTITQTIEFDGSYTPQPKISIVLKAITNLDKITLTNLTTGDSVTIDETWVVNDVILFDMANRVVTRNNTMINYADTLPRFILGKNIVQISLISTGEIQISQLTSAVELGGQL